MKAVDPIFHEKKFIPFRFHSHRICSNREKKNTFYYSKNVDAHETEFSFSVFFLLYFNDSLLAENLANEVKRSQWSNIK